MASTGEDLNQFIGSIALVVKDYDEAIDFFKNKLDFELIHDEILSPKKRWVRIRPGSSNPSPSASCILLAKADGETQEAAVGNQTGGRMFMFLETDDVVRDYNKYKGRGVKFIREPTEGLFSGTAAVFEDLYGNKWDLIQKTHAVSTCTNQFIGSMALVVKDYDNAIDFFKNKLEFELVQDEVMSPKKRWVLLRPGSSNPSPSTCCILLAKADGETQEAAIGNQTGGRVFMFLHTDDFQRDYNKYKDRGVKFIREPAEQDYGTVAVFEDLCGNKWDLVQFKNNVS